jgi:hypothetical protein
VERDLAQSDIGSSTQHSREQAKENAARLPGRRVMVEAAGQLIHLFRDGLDYAFILHAGCGACYPSIVADES